MDYKTEVFLVFLFHHQLQEKEQKLEDMDKEQEFLIDMISKERDEKIVEENKWREKLRVSKKKILIVDFNTMKVLLLLMKSLCLP